MRKTSINFRGPSGLSALLYSSLETLRGAISLSHFKTICALLALVFSAVGLQGQWQTEKANHYRKGAYYLRVKQSVASSFNTCNVNTFLQVNGVPSSFTPKVLSLSRPFYFHDKQGLAGLNIIEQLERVFAIQLDSINTDYDAFLDDLRASGNFEVIEAIPNVTTSALPPNDPRYSTSQPNLTGINALTAWQSFNSGTGPSNSNVVIAIIDDAVMITHEDLRNSLWVNPGEIPNNNIDDDGNGVIDDIHGVDVSTMVSFGGGSVPVSGNPIHPNPANTHGTHVAGIAGATSNNGLGIASLAFNVKLMSIRSADNNGNLSPTIYAGITYAINKRARIINMSWGGYSYSLIEQQIIDLAAANGILCVAAAGNGNTYFKNYPAAYNNVLSVASTDNIGNISCYSNYGAWIDVAAPGENITSCLASSTNINSYGLNTGTSMASPLVASLAALLLQKNPILTNYELTSIIKATAQNIDGLASNVTSFKLGQWGTGMIDAASALNSTNNCSIPISNLAITSSNGGSMLGTTGSTTLGLSTQGVIANWRAVGPRTIFLGNGVSSVNFQPPVVGNYTIIAEHVNGQGFNHSCFAYSSFNISVKPSANQIDWTHERVGVNGANCTQQSIPLSNGDFLVSAIANSMNGPDYELQLTRYKIDGSIIWENRIDCPINPSQVYPNFIPFERYFKIAERTSNGDIFITSVVKNNNAVENDLCIIRVNSNGAVLDRKKLVLQTSGIVFPDDIKHKNGYIYIGGTIYDGTSDVFLMKIDDTNYNIDWSKVFGSQNMRDHSMVVQPTESNTILTSFITVDPNIGDVGEIFHLDINGNGLWNKRMLQPVNTLLPSHNCSNYLAVGIFGIHEFLLDDGSFIFEKQMFRVQCSPEKFPIMGGFMETDGYGFYGVYEKFTQEPFILLFDKNFNLRSIKAYPSSNIIVTTYYAGNTSPSIIPFQVLPTSDNGYVLVSHSYSGATNKYGTDVKKIGQEGYSCDMGAYEFTEQGPRLMNVLVSMNRTPTNLPFAVQNYSQGGVFSLSAISTPGCSNILCQVPSAFSVKLPVTCNTISAVANGSLQGTWELKNSSGALLANQTGNTFNFLAPTGGAFNLTFNATGSCGPLTKKVEVCDLANPAFEYDYACGFFRGKALASGSIHTWDFGDNTVLTTPNQIVTHKYANPGIYTVRHTIFNSCSAPVTWSTQLTQRVTEVGTAATTPVPNFTDAVNSQFWAATPTTPLFFKVFGEFTLDNNPNNPNMNIPAGSIILVDGGGKITINPNRTTSILQSTITQCDGVLWQGIELNSSNSSTGAQLVIDRSEIHGARVGLSVKPVATPQRNTLNIQRSVFRNCYIGMKFDYTGFSSNSVAFTCLGNTFERNTNIPANYQGMTERSGGHSLAGIWIRNVPSQSIFVVGTNQRTLQNINLFRGLRNGIYAEGASLVASNNDFEDIKPKFIVPGYAGITVGQPSNAPYKEAAWEGSGIVAMSSNNYSSFLVVDNITANGSPNGNFRQCKFGVYQSGSFYASIKNSSFLDTEKGINSLMNGNIFQVYDCNISVKTNGIAALNVPDAGGGRIDLQRNTINVRGDIIVSRNLPYSGINVTGSVSANTNTQNTIKQNRIIMDDGITGIGIMKMRRANVEENSVFISSGNNAVAIRLASCDGNIGNGTNNFSVKCNNVVGHAIPGSPGSRSLPIPNQWSNHTTYLGTGILVSDCPSINYITNDLSNTEIGMRFAGSNNQNSAIRGNAFRTHQTGLLIGRDAHVGEQTYLNPSTNAPEANNNQWLGASYLNGSAWHQHPDRNTILNNNSFLFNTQQGLATIQNPDNQRIGTGTVTPWFVFNRMPYYAINPDCSQNERPGGKEEDWLETVAEGAVQNLEFDDPGNWIYDQYLYEKMQEDDAPLFEEPVYQSFEDSVEQTELAKIYEAKQALLRAQGMGSGLERQISQNDSLVVAQMERLAVLDTLTGVDSLRAICKQLISYYQEQGMVLRSTLDSYQNNEKLNAEALLNGLNPDAIYEFNEKQVGLIGLHKFREGSPEPNAADLETLRSIAIQCPKIGGNAVYTARVLYGVYRDTLYDDEAACAAMSVSWRLAPGAAQPQTTFSLHPNPADEIVFLNISQELKEEARLEIIDMLGKVVESFTFPVRAMGAWPLSIEKLSPAVYQTRIVNAKGELLDSSKLVIVR